MKEVASKLNIKVSGVPVVIIGDEVVNGILMMRQQEKKIRNIIEQHSGHGCADVVGSIIDGENGDGKTECEEEGELETNYLTFFW